MRLGPHIAASGAAGAIVWAATGEPWALPIAVAGGVLPDADHLLDYYLWYVKRRFNRILLIFHAWEYLAVMVAVYAGGVREPWLLALIAGYFTQIGGDQLFNGVFWHTYLITARIRYRFKVVRVIGTPRFQAYRALVESLPYVGRKYLQPWFESRLRRSS